MDTSDAHYQITEAIDKSKYHWRTPSGISKDSRIPLPQVLNILEQSDKFIRARQVNSRGESLYSTKSKYEDKNTLGKRLLSALTNTIVE
jgi:hypothetical protein